MRPFDTPKVAARWVALTILMVSQPTILFAGDRVAGDKVAGDKVAGDKVAGDKVAGDKVAGDKVAGDKTDDAAAQSGVAAQNDTSETLEETDDDQGIGTVLIPLGGYTPETSVAFSGIGVLYSKDKHAATRWRTTLAAAYTFKNQALGSAYFNLSFGHERYRLKGAVSVAKWTDKFFGIGPDVTGTNESLDVLRGTFEISALRRIADTELYVGLLQEDEVRRTQADPDGVFDQYRPGGAGNSRRIGLGAKLVYDTRDSQTGTHRGIYISADATVFRRWWGSSTDYARIGADIRGFLPLGDHVLAARLRAGSRLGDAPFYDLGELGGSDLLRGIYEGRFRDHHMAAIQGEYRSPILWWRLGLVGFGGVGVVEPTIDAFDMGDAQWGAGGGIRVLLSEERGIKLRLDGAFSADDWGVYVSIGEAF